MKKFKCEICNKKLHINTYRARKMHINGYKHKLLKETRVMELNEDEKIKYELERNKRLFGEKYDLFFGKQNFGFRLPPYNFKQDFTIPPCPKNFKLPRYFDFTNSDNFKPDINENLQDILKKLT
ncbi:putative U1 small nuclear ribonucleoprotein [Vairimorpha necatrix]|uniref:U1 small nuclear ribonucleoprotein n=1 Tax=Vairimorpha necatrix TaxID=6039 RepID=A0AAX4JDX8_9MICR